MNESTFSKISSLSESFCRKCFKYEKDAEGIDANLNEMVKIIKNYSEDIKELLLVFVEKGARTAFLKSALPKIQTGEKATDGVTSDNEFRLFLDTLTLKYADTSDYDIVVEIFKHLMVEIDNISAEINITTLQSFSVVDATYDQNQRSVKEQINTMNKNLNDLRTKSTSQVSEFEDEIHSVERKMYESNITILGIFSAVVLIFNAAVSFYSSTINAFSDASTYKILVVLLIIGVIVLGSTMGLFYYLDKVRKSAKSDAEKYVLKELTGSPDSQNDIANDSACKKTVYIYDKTEGKGSVFSSLLPFLITIVLLIIALIAVVAFWKQGYIESRNKEVCEQFSETVTTTVANATVQTPKVSGAIFLI